ncbi:hypothetical protein BH11PAT3_BH11PAT3_0020 [soil metagenome]
MEDSTSKPADNISNVIWGLYIGFNFLVDVVMFILINVLVVGIFFNPIISFCMAGLKAMFIFFFKVRLSTTQILTTIGFSAGDMVGDGELPLLGVSAIFLMLNHKASFVLDKVPGISKVT